jgi:hypothetical protein
LDGYEIKSNRDSLDRLGYQASIYGRIFDHLTLVASERHIASASDQLPDWWGLAVVTTTSGRIASVRDAAPNPSLDPHARVRLLWRDEAAVALAERVGHRQRSPRRVLWQQLADMTTEDELRDVVCQSLRERVNWRVAD